MERTAMSREDGSRGRGSTRRGVGSRGRGPKTKIVGILLLGMLIFWNFFRGTEFPRSGLEWARLCAEAVLAAVVLVAWWRLLTNAFLSSYWVGLAGMLFWPYLVFHGLVHLPGRSKWLVAVFLGGLVLGSLLRFGGGV